MIKKQLHQTFGRLSIPNLLRGIGASVMKPGNLQNPKPASTYGSLVSLQ